MQQKENFTDKTPDLKDYSLALELLTPYLHPKEKIQLTYVSRRSYNHLFRIDTRFLINFSKKTPSSQLKSKKLIQSLTLKNIQYEDDFYKLLSNLKQNGQTLENLNELVFYNSSDRHRANVFFDYATRFLSGLESVYYIKTTIINNRSIDLWPNIKTIIFHDIKYKDDTFLFLIQGLINVEYFSLTYSNLVRANKNSFHIYSLPNFISLTNLKSLKIDYIDCRVHLTDWEPEADSQYYQRFSQLQNLEYLYFDNIRCPNCEYLLKAASFLNITNYLPKLKGLYINSLKPLSRNDSQNFFFAFDPSRHSNLQRLAIKNISFPENLLAFFPNDTLVTLDLSNSSNLKESLLTRVVKQNPLLTTINLSVTKVTGEFLPQIETKISSQISTLILDYCKKLDYTIFKERLPFLLMLKKLSLSHSNIAQRPILHYVSNKEQIQDLSLLIPINFQESPYQKMYNEVKPKKVYCHITHKIKPLTHYSEAINEIFASPPDELIIQQFTSTINNNLYYFDSCNFSNLNSLKIASMMDSSSSQVKTNHKFLTNLANKSPRLENLLISGFQLSEEDLDIIFSMRLKQLAILNCNTFTSQDLIDQFLKHPTLIHLSIRNCSFFDKEKIMRLTWALQEQEIYAEKKLRYISDEHLYHF